MTRIEYKVIIELPTQEIEGKEHLNNIKNEIDACISDVMDEMISDLISDEDFEYDTSISVNVIR